MQLGEKTIGEIANCSAIVKHLFTAELKRLDDLLDSIVTDHEKKTGQSGLAGFMYMGEFYTRKGASRAPMHGERSPLDSSLFNKMDTYLQQSGKLLKDVHMINQMVFRLTNGCMNRQDIRDALPECIVVQDKEMELSKHDRTRKSAYTLTGDARALRQYDKVLPLMEYYSATHLLY